MSGKRSFSGFCTKSSMKHKSLCNLFEKLHATVKLLPIWHPLVEGHTYFSVPSPQIIVNNYKYICAADTTTPHFSRLSPHSIIYPSAQRTPHLLTSHFYLLTL